MAVHIFNIVFLEFIINCFQQFVCNHFLKILIVILNLKCLSITCLITHVYGYLLSYEALPHATIFCATYAAFMCISIFGCIGKHGQIYNKNYYIIDHLFLIAALFVGFGIHLFYEIIILNAGAVFYIVSAIVTMYHAEKDTHLLYLTDKEEHNHRYFNINLTLVGRILYISLVSQ